MQWQHRDVAKEFADSDGGRHDDTTFLGGTAEADLWLTNNGVLVCQYDESIEDYVSYWPADAVWHHAQGKISPETSTTGSEVKNSPVVWYGSGYAIEKHDAEAIAAYLLCFVPHVFSTETLNDMYTHNGVTHES